MTVIYEKPTVIITQDGISGNRANAFLNDMTAAVEQTNADAAQTAIDAAATAADRALAQTAATESDTARDEAVLYGGPRVINIDAFFTSTAPTIAMIGKRFTTMDGSGAAWDIVTAGTGDLNHPVTGVGVSVVVEGGRAVVPAFYGRTGGSGTDTAAWQRAITRVKAMGGGEVHLPMRTGAYYVDDTVLVAGNFGYKGIKITGANVEVISSAAGAAIKFNPNVSGDNPPQIKQRSVISGVAFAGPGRLITGTMGIYIEHGATVDTADCKIRSFEKGIVGLGALILRNNNLELYNNSWGYYFDSTITPPFAPNDIHFTNCKIFENTRIGFAGNFPNGCMTFNECELEGNNITGNNADGIKIMEFDRAGVVNIIGCHIEANYGQWHIYFAAGAAHSALNIIGGQIIPGNNNTAAIEMATTYGAWGHLQIIGARVTNAIANQIIMGTGASAFISGETAGNVQGDLSKVVRMKNGKISTGTSDTPANAGMRSKGSSGIAHDFEGQIRFVDASNNRLGYIQNPAASVLGFVNDQDNQGVQFNTKIAGASAARFYVSRLGGQSVEPGADNTMTMGSTALRWLRGFFSELRLGTAGAIIVTAGTGSPEGVVTAPVGSVYLRTDGAGNSLLYTKKTGSGNTDWVAMQEALTQGSAVADATDAASVITQLNALLAQLRTRGTIA